VLKDDKDSLLKYSENIMLFKEDMKDWIKRHVRAPKIKTEDFTSVSDQFEALFETAFEAEIATAATLASISDEVEVDGKKKRSRPSNEHAEPALKRKPSDDAEDSANDSLQLDHQGKVSINTELSMTYH
jgi:molecular chaperone DnaK (HSP70)